MTIGQAIRSFARGYSLTRSFTHPYEAHPLGPLIVLRDGPRKSGDFRREEILVHGLSPAEAVRLIRAYDPHRHSVCAIEALGYDQKTLKAGYKAEGYRLIAHEPLFVRDLSIDSSVPDPMAVRVNDRSMAQSHLKASRDRGILPEHLGIGDAPVRLYNAIQDGEIVGWVRSVDAGDGVRWVSNLHVREEYRRRGIGSRLMHAMLADDRRLGKTHSVLLASTTGSKLYPTLGYDQIGSLLLFAPKRGS